MIYKKTEFELFLKYVKEGQKAHWVDVANAIGVNQDTITAWKNSDEGQKAVAEGITHALEQMQESGANDWRMWAEKLKMLGVNPTTKVDVNKIGSDPIDELLIAYGIKERPKDDGQTDEAVSRSSESQT